MNLRDGISDLCTQPGIMVLLCASVCTSTVCACKTQRDSKKKDIELMFLSALLKYVVL